MRIPPRNKKIKSYWFGIIAEYIAIFFLLMNGYKILKRRYKTFAGEVDIIARKSKAIISVEVKARRKKMVENGFLIDGQLFTYSPAGKQTKITHFKKGKVIKVENL